MSTCYEPFFLDIMFLYLYIFLINVKIKRFIESYLFIIMNYFNSIIFHMIILDINNKNVRYNNRYMTCNYESNKEQMNIE